MLATVLYAAESPIASPGLQVASDQSDRWDQPDVTGQVPEVPDQPVPAGRSTDTTPPAPGASLMKRMGTNLALREFLTRRRGQIMPVSVGLKSTKKRRSKGLTREDMAELTGVSFKWYTLFESGAGKGVSRKFAERVVQVLGLNDAERHYLLSLMGFADLGVVQAVPTAVPASLQRLVHDVQHVGMALHSPLMDLLASNTAYRAWFPASQLDHEYANNSIWRLFMDADYRALWLDWPGAVERAVADLRYSTSSLRHTAEYQTLLAALHQSPAFVAAWSDDTVRLGELPSTFDLATPQGGRIGLSIMALKVPTAHALLLTAVVPASGNPD